MFVSMKSRLFFAAASFWKHGDPSVVGTLGIIVACLGVLATVLLPG